MSTRRFDALCATIVSATTFCGVNVSATNLTATNLYAPNFTSTRELIFCAAGALSAGNQAPYIHVPFSGTVTSIYSVVKSASTGGITADILRCPSTLVCATSLTWTTILSGKITIDANEYSTRTAASAAALSGTQTFGADDLFRINIDSIGAGEPEDLTVGVKVTT
jgi:hypothetical protein